MKKVLFTLLCCTVFIIGCKKAPQDQVVTTEQVEATATVANDVLISSGVAASTDTVATDVATSTETISQGEVK
ncbi:MAG: hypothetical protein PHY39_04785 [Endomicrobiaceae bacterium]|nr:hypothetical protein [Endomicrobiaceae bacterium]